MSGDQGTKTSQEYFIDLFVQFYEQEFGERPNDASLDSNMTKDFFMDQISLREWSAFLEKTYSCSLTGDPQTLRDYRNMVRTPRGPLSPQHAPKKMRSSQEYLTQPAVMQKLNLSAENIPALIADIQVFEFGEVVGEGMFSQVIQAVDRTNGKELAIKVVIKEYCNKSALANLEEEVRIMAICDHPNIIKLLGVYDDEEVKCLAMPLCAGGDLFDAIVEKVVFKETDAQDAVRQLLSALKYVHDRRIVHRDVKPENILFTTTDLDQLVLADFGFAAQLENQKQRLSLPCGTLNYAAPEVISESYGLSVDMWSVGITAYFMLCGSPPFYDDKAGDIGLLRTLEQVRRGKLTDVLQWPEKAPISEEGKDFILKLLLLDPEGRMTAGKALNHKWLLESTSLAISSSFSVEAFRTYTRTRSESVGQPEVIARQFRFVLSIPRKIHVRQKRELRRSGSSSVLEIMSPSAMRKQAQTRRYSLGKKARAHSEESGLSQAENSAVNEFMTRRALAAAEDLEEVDKVDKVDEDLESFNESAGGGDVKVVEEQLTQGQVSRGHSFMQEFM